MSDIEEAATKETDDSEEATPEGSSPETPSDDSVVTLKQRLEEFDKKTGFIPAEKKKKRGFRSLSPKEVLIWAAITLLMSFSLSSPFGLYCVWRKVKAAPTTPKRFKWIPTFGKPIPKEGYRSLVQKNQRIAKFFTPPPTSATSQKWLMLTGVFVIIIGFGLSLTPVGLQLVYGYSPDVLWQYIQCFCIMLAGSLLIRASARIRAEHMREQSIYLLASNFDALPLKYASEIFSIPAPVLADSLQKVIDFDLLGNSYIDYLHWIYAQEDAEQPPEKKKQRMEFFSRQLKAELDNLEEVDLRNHFQTFDQIAQVLVNRTIDDEKLYKYSIEYLDFYYPLIIALAKGSRQIAQLEPMFSETEIANMSDRKRRKAAKKKKDGSTNQDPEKLFLQFAYDKKDVGLLAVENCVDEVNEQIQEILKDI